MRACQHVARPARYASYDAAPASPASGPAAGGVSNSYMNVSTVVDDADAGGGTYDLDHPDADNYGPMATAANGNDFDAFDESDTDI